VRDQDGEPLPGVAVAFVVTRGGGSVAVGSSLTDGAGVATSGGWTLGTTAGANSLQAAVEGVASVTFESTGIPGPPASLVVIAGAGQLGRVGEPVATPPAVRVSDAFGNPIPDVEVSFQVGAGAGHVEGGLQRTDALGVAAVGGWRLGTLVGENRLDVTASGGAQATVVAHAFAGAPAVMSRHAGGGTVAQVATAVGEPPVVRVADAFGNPVEGVSVSFRTGVGGAVEPAGAETDAQGLAAVTRWELGATAGVQTLTASADGLPPVTFDVTATAAAPAAVQPFAGQSQTAPADAPVSVRPAAVVSDAYGNRVRGAAVTFVVTAGGGSVTGPVQQTNRDGVATVVAWTLGPAPGPNALEARLAGGAAATFEATATTSGAGSGGSVDNGSFEIDLRFGAGLTASQQTVFRRAVARWEEIVVGDVPSVRVAVDENSCGRHPAMDETVEDVVVYASAVAIDGVSGALGRAGPCLVRSGSFLPLLGFMEFDAEDLAVLETSGDLLPVILHEIGHVLGIGTVWELKGLLEGKGTTFPWFPGEHAVAAFDAAGGAVFFGAKVPVENTGGASTRESHWRESVLGTELMTGYMNGGVANPLSAVTAASLRDVGYTVDSSRTDPYTLGAPLTAPGAERRRLDLTELPIPPPVVVSPDGTRLPPGSP
jgi:hypothetical protein